VAKDIEDQPFSLEEKGEDDEAYAASYQVAEREVNTSPADPDVETILKRIEQKNLILRPDFQRASVWNNTQKSKLIESLLLNLPIPPCFLAEDGDTVRVVVDGQQRLRSIDDFYHGRYALTGLQVLEDLNGKFWADLPPKLDRKILQRVIRTLVISHHANSGIRFEIFERLNSGGEPLTEQEIRNATLRGSFNVMLNAIATFPAFLGAMAVKKPDERLRHHELILRFFAVRAAVLDYKPPLKMILSEFMLTHRFDDQSAIKGFEKLFTDTENMVQLVFGKDSFKRYREKEGVVGFETSISKAVFELQMISTSFLQESAVRAHAGAIAAAFKSLSLGNQTFAESLSRATDHRKRYSHRLRLWNAELVKLGLDNDLTAILAGIKE
jgi:hypothetical protein